MIPVDKFCLKKPVRQHKGRRTMLAFAEDVSKASNLTVASIRHRMGFKKRRR